MIEIDASGYDFREHFGFFISEMVDILLVTEVSCLYTSTDLFMFWQYNYN